MKDTDVLGVKVNQTTFEEALEKAKSLVDSGNKHYVVTPNPELIVAARKDKEFRDILNRADLSIPDGAGLVTLANLTGRKLPERVTGVDFTLGLAGMAEEFGYRLFLLGGEKSVAEKAANELKKRFPKLKISGTYSGNPEAKFDIQTVSAIKKTKTDILTVAFGAPKQEKWISRNLPKLNVKLAIGVGGALDYISGEKKRAPKFVQDLNLEWLYRLVREPTRFKRQLALPYFAYLILKEKSQKKNPS